MKNVGVFMATALLVLAGCGDREQAIAPETVEPAVQETAADAEMVAAESQPAESVDAALTAAEEETGAVVESATETAAGVTEQAAAVADVAGQAQPPAAAAADLAQGEAIYKKSCMACHGMGVAGAPKLGEPEQWAPRIAQGMDTLVQHATEGFKGAKGYMPPRGGFMSLSDAEVSAAVAYMVSESS